MRAQTLLAALLVTGCAKPTDVELRLVPCGAPVRVDLEVQGFDAGGAALMALNASYAIDDPGVFSDGYATVGLRKPDGLVTADFTLTWHGSGDAPQVVTLTGVVVPAAGEVLELGAAECTAVGGTSTTTPTGDESTSTGAPTSTEVSTSTGTSSTGDDTTSTTSTTDVTTGTSTSDETTSGTTDATTSDESTSTGGDTIEGEGCAGQENELYCEGGGAGEVGHMLKCNMVTKVWDAVDAASVCKPEDWCPFAMVMLVDPKVVGCSGVGKTLACMCQGSLPEEPCSEADQGCGADEVITLCHEAMDGLRLTKSVCAVCDESTPMMPYCM